VSDESVAFKMEDWASGFPMRAGPLTLGLYQPSPETREYWQGVERRELLLRFCSHCNRAYHPKRIVCTDCGAGDLTWRRSSGGGKVYSFSEIHRAPTEAFAANAPYTNGIVELSEGVYLFARLIPDPGPIAIDAPARLDFRILELGSLLPVYLIG
jgi:uncharacterized protein